MSQAQKISFAILPEETDNISPDDLIISKWAPTEQKAAIQVSLKKGVSRKCHKWRTNESERKQVICHLGNNGYLWMKNDLKELGDLQLNRLQALETINFYINISSEKSREESLFPKILNLLLFNFLLSVLVQNSVCYQIVSILLKIPMTRNLSSTLKK